MCSQQNGLGGGLARWLSSLLLCGAAGHVVSGIESFGKVELGVNG